GRLVLGLDQALTELATGRLAANPAHQAPERAKRGRDLPALAGLKRLEVGREPADVSLGHAEPDPRRGQLRLGAPGALPPVIGSIPVEEIAPFLGDLHM